jgi:transketolase C-terminal domain/subunit
LCAALPVAWPRHDHIEEHILEIGLADLDILGVQAGFADGGQVALHLVRCARAIARFGP